MTARRLVAAGAATALAVVAAAWLATGSRSARAGQERPGGATTADRPAAVTARAAARAPARPVTMPPAGADEPRPPAVETDPSAGVGDAAAPEVSAALLGALATVTERARPCFAADAVADALAYTVTFEVRGHRAEVVGLDLDDDPAPTPALECVKGAVVQGGTLPLPLPDATIPVSSEWLPDDLAVVR